jgi:PPOX class probable F420-dependent enzyme
VDVDTMRRRVAEARVARLATVRRDGTPHVVPICFALTTAADGTDVLVSATDDKPKTTYSLQRLKNVEANPAVTFLVDHYEEEWGRVWWVRVDGQARIVDGGTEHERAAAALREKYEQYAHLDMPGAMLAIDVRRWVGWAYDGS